MKKRWIVIGIWSLGAVLIGTGQLNGCLGLNEDRGMISYAAGQSQASKSIQEKIKKSNETTKSLEEEKKALKKEVASLENKKSDVVSYIQGLDQKLDDLSTKVEQNETNLKKTKKEIRVLKKEKKAAESKKEIQYDSMLKRIKYVYENGDQGYWEVLLGADSLSEFLNRAEYVNKVSSYDRNLLKEYQKTCDTITTAQNKLENDLADLTTLRKSLKLKKDSMNTIMDKKTDELQKYQVSIDQKSSSVKNTDNLLAKQEAQLEALMAAQRKQSEKEEAARKAAEKKAAQKKAAQKSTSHAAKATKAPQTAATKAPQTNTDTSTTKVSVSGFRWTLTVSGRITSYFGYRTSPTAGASSNHKGIDISVPVGSTVVAAKAGTVVTAAYSASAGNYIAISHGDGVYTYYMHCSSLAVSSGAKVSQGQKIALSGNTGVSTGPHLHFAVYAGGTYVNPLNYVSQ